MRLRSWLLFGALFAITAGFCALSLGFFRAQSIEAAIWPANAVVLAFLLLGFERTRERAAGIGVAFAAILGTNLAFGLPPEMSVGFAFANAVEIGVAAWFLRSLRMPLSDPADYLRFAGGAIVAGPLAGTLCATVAMAATGMAEGSALLDFGVRWFRADALAMAVVAPFALSMGAVVPDLDRRAGAGVAPAPQRNLLRSILAQCLVLAIPVAACLPISVIFPFSVFIFPAVAIAVFAGRDRGGVVAVFIVAAVLVTGAAFGTGPAGRAAQVGADGLLMVQALLAALVATVHPLSAVLRRLDAYAAEAEARRAQAESASASKTRFLSVMSEELRSPLTGVLTVAELVKSGRIGSLTPKQRELMAHLVESGEQIDALTRRLVDAAALQSGARGVRGEVFNLSSLLVGTITAARFQARRDCDIRLCVAADVLEIDGDPQRLRQSLIKLISDASRYCGKPGLVQVSAFDTGQGQIRIQIEDDGDGVPVERLLELNSASAETSGLGVGLGLIRDLMRLQGGDLGVESGSLGGARVWIVLPAAQADAVWAA